MRAIGVLLLSVSGLVAGAESPAQSSFVDGLRLYKLGRYQAAIVAFERSVRAEPDASEYHHWLGKAYGRLAEHSNVLAALRLAGKTRRAFERAVELDEANAAALESLALYYERAPALLGGDRQKAERLRERLEGLTFDE